MTRAKTQAIDIDKHLDFKEHKGINVADPVDDLDIVNLQTLKKMKSELTYNIGDGLDLVMNEETGDTNEIISEADPHIYPAILDDDERTFIVQTQNYSPRSFKLSLTHVFIHIDSDMPENARLKLNPYSAYFYIFENGSPVKSGIKAGSTLHLVSVPARYTPYNQHEQQYIGSFDVMSIISCTQTNNANYLTEKQVDDKITEAIGNISDMLDIINRAVI